MLNNCRRFLKVKKLKSTLLGNTDIVSTVFQQSEEVEAWCFHLRYRSVSEGDFKRYTSFLKSLVKEFEIRCEGGVAVGHVRFVTLPKKRKRLTVFKSPHVHKKAKDQFERVLHSGQVSIIFKSTAFIHFANILNSLSINKPKSLNLKTELTSNIVRDLSCILPVHAEGIHGVR
jgi:ribosomal protein S10